ncbi:MAG: hypothetical protein HY717_23595 [Planctomycetes bacterium]|nr:hypothetical protein [Planctomycetota bacterium]
MNELEIAREKFGLKAFGDPAKILKFLAIVLGAVALGAVLAYHPHYLHKVTSLEEVDQPKIFITYTVIGAVVAIVVGPFPTMAFAIFGIGGLMRFRTELGAARETGRVILATIIGLCCGLEFWLAAVIATILAWLLILGLDWKVAHAMIVRGIDRDRIKDSSEAYSSLLEEYGCRVLQVRRNPKKEQFSVLFKSSRKITRDGLEVAFEDEIDEKLRGTIDWPEEG